MSTGFVYSYSIIEDRQGEKNAIASYLSNAVPPAIGTTLRLAELIDSPKQVPFKVLDVIMYPGQIPGDKRGMSSLTLIFIEVMKADGDFLT